MLLSLDANEGKKFFIPKQMEEDCVWMSKRSSLQYLNASLAESCMHAKPGVTVQQPRDSACLFRYHGVLYLQCNII